MHFRYTDFLVFSIGFGSSGSITESLTPPDCLLLCTSLIESDRRPCLMPIFDRKDNQLPISLIYSTGFDAFDLYVFCTYGKQKVAAQADKYGHIALGPRLPVYAVSC